MNKKGFINVLKLFIIFSLVSASIGLFYYKFSRTYKVSSGKNEINGVREIDKKDEELPEIAEKKTEIQSKISGVCDNPILYSIGDMDTQFGINREKFLKTIIEAEKIWEDGIKINVFDYSPDGELKINLIFDERQQSSNEAKTLEQEIDELSSGIGSTENKYDKAKKEFENKEEEYEDDLRDYEKRSKKYADNVAYWNSKGGASEDEFNKLKKEASELEDMFEELEKKLKNVNELADAANKRAKKENEIVKEYNEAIETYKNKFGISREFEKGNYSISDVINIYQFETVEDLRLTLVHELGHARGVGHVENSKSIMHYLLSEQNMNNLKLSQEDILGIDIICN